MFDWSFPIILGWDVAGVITEVGSQVTDWQVGDKVFLVLKLLVLVPMQK